VLLAGGNSGCSGASGMYEGESGGTGTSRAAATGEGIVGSAAVEETTTSVAAACDGGVATGGAEGTWTGGTTSPNRGELVDR
jgi:hypothetical protein